MKDINSISILGCGWLGLPLAKRLLKEGYSIKGSTTTPSKIPILKEAGIYSFLINLTHNLRSENLLGFLKSDLLILNIPPGRRNPNAETEFPDRIKMILEAGKSVGLKNILFVSSTSVYGNGELIVDESSPINPTTNSGKALAQAEDLIKAENEIRSIILRPGGLTGPERPPGRFLSGRKDVPGQFFPVNMLHLEDAVKIIQFLIERPFNGQIVNAVSPIHPTKKDFYSKAAESLGLEAPQFQKENTATGKTVQSSWLLENGYSFTYPDPMQYPELSTPTGPASE